MIIQILILLAFAALNVFTADYQAKLFAKNKSINKSLWAFAYCLLAAIPLIWNEWLLFVIIVIMRFIVFDPALNIYRGLPVFYSNTADPAGSKLDKFMGKYKEYYYYAALLIFIGLNVILFK